MKYRRLRNTAISERIPERLRKAKFLRDLSAEGKGGRGGGGGKREGRGERGRGRRREVCSPGCGGYYLNRNRNSRSVLGIDYTIAHVRAVHMNRIRDDRRVSYNEEERNREEKRRVRGSSLISSMHENKSRLHGHAREKIRVILAPATKPQRRIGSRATNPRNPREE